MIVMRIMAMVLVFMLPLTQQGCTQSDAPVYDEIAIIGGDGGEIAQFNVELATTPKQQAKGMMHRTEMANDFGMLFLFEGMKMRSFWMKNTYLPLDIIFIDDTGQIVHIHDNARPLDETHISSAFPAIAVLEIKGGQAYAQGIAAGDRIEHRFFNQ